jgi:Carboxypeptidase regulatory-like domain
MLGGLRNYIRGPGSRPKSLLLPIIGLTLFSSIEVRGQTASTGAVTGVTLDSSGAAVPGVTIDLFDSSGTERVSATSDEEGRFGFLLLPPGTYELVAKKSDFKCEFSGSTDHLRR